MAEPSPPIPAGDLDHVSLAVPDLDAAMALYRDRFGCLVSDPIEIAAQGIRMAYVQLGNAKIELMEPLDESSPIAAFIARNPAGGIHHFCLTTENADGAAAAASEAGVRVLGKPGPGHHGRQLFFIHPKDSLGALIEIEEAD